MEIGDEQLEKDIELMHEERKNHRGLLVRLIEAMGEVVKEASQCKEDISEIRDLIRE